MNQLNASAGTKTALYGLLAAIMLLASQVANAACTSTPAMPYLQAANNMAVVTTLPVGSTIPGTVRNYTFSGICDNVPPNVVPGAQIIACYYGSGTEGPDGVYSTGVPGVGIRLRNAAGQAIAHASSVWCNTTGQGLGNLNADMTYSVSVSIEFVKTGPTSGGTLDPMQTRFGFGVYQGSTAGALGGGGVNYIGFSGSAVPRPITCNVNYPATVTLQPVRAADLRPAGTSAGATPFTIGVTCDTPANVGVTFDGAPGTPVLAASSGVLGPSNAGAPGAATGVGFQVVTGGSYQPVPLQTRNDLGSIQANVPASYSYAVRYIGLNNGLPVTAGKVVSAATFTFDYQ
ncbi:fimbrial protein [Cupriavidus sp. WKF15]|uniref:fimbrial protein n=1 Tax=Cupriavidus sp. WKF15 TaxID=3032282 RepID=UPI0023E10588|nr:fimbrial protein [Cupriavidus sp. WKF15]WER47480.1 fimbrial protein [Cupriavidus sp. WKF15]